MKSFMLCRQLVRLTYIPFNLCCFVVCCPVSGAEGRTTASGRADPTEHPQHDEPTGQACQLPQMYHTIKILKYPEVEM